MVGYEDRIVEFDDGYVNEQMTKWHLSKVEALAAYIGDRAAGAVETGKLNFVLDFEDESFTPCGHDTHTLHVNVSSLTDGEVAEILNDLRTNRDNFHRAILSREFDFARGMVGGEFLSLPQQEYLLDLIPTIEDKVVEVDGYRWLVLDFTWLEVEDSGRAMRI